MNLVGLDLGKVRDPSACCVFTRKEFPAKVLEQLPDKPQRYGPEPAPPEAVTWDQVDPGVAARRAAELRRYRELNPRISGDRTFDDPEEMEHAPKPPKMDRRYLCRMLRKWQLGTSYVQVVEDVRRLCGNPLLQSTSEGIIQPPTLVVDGTGLGAPVIDMLLKARVPAKLVAIDITGGSRVRVDDVNPMYWFVPKIILVSVVQVMLQTRRIDFAANLRDPKTKEDMQAALMQELRDFRETQTKNPKANNTFEAEEGSHDDLLLACSYALWWGERGGRKANIW